MEHSKESSKGQDQGNSGQSHKGTDKNENKGSRTSKSDNNKGRSKK